MTSIIKAAACFLAISAGTQLHGAPKPTKDITFAEADGHPLKLDLYLPKKTKSPPLVIFIHGGGWNQGSYKSCLTHWLTDYGFAVASISYRFTDKATFPSQVHDCKAAVRWLRKHADDYGYNADRIGVAGNSAGGYLSLFLGVTSGDKTFDGKIGSALKQGSEVHAVVDYFGPSDFIERSKAQPNKTEKPKSPVYRLLGHSVTKNPQRAKLASPVSHVRKNSPPLLILHGDNDHIVQLSQSELIHKAYEKAGAESELTVIEGGNHGGKAFFTKARKNQVAQFLEKHLAPKP